MSTYIHENTIWGAEMVTYMELSGMSMVQLDTVHSRSHAAGLLALRDASQPWPQPRHNKLTRLGFRVV